MNSPNFNRFDVGEGQLSSTFASTSSDNSNLSAEEEPVGGGGLEQVGNLPLSLLPSSSSAPSPSSSLLSPRMTCRESEERERATLKREEKKKEGDPLEEVREGIVRMMEEKREKQHLTKVLSELREAHKELEEEVKVLREENKRLKEAVLVVDGRRRGRRREEERSSPDGQERERVDEEGLIGPSVHNGKRLLQEVYRLQTLRCALQEECDSLFLRRQRISSSCCERQPPERSNDFPHPSTTSLRASPPHSCISSTPPLPPPPLLFSTSSSSSTSSDFFNII